MGFVILGFCDQWDEYERRDYALMSRLAKFDDVDGIVYVQPVLPFTSFLKYVLGGADQYATFAWRQILTEGRVLRKGKIILVPSFSALPFYGYLPFHSTNVAITNWMRVCKARRMLKKIDATQVVLWISNPYFTSDLIGQFGEKLVCYNLCEDYSQKHSDLYYRQLLIGQDQAISRKADLLFMASEDLVSERRELCNQVYLVPNGVDYEGIRAAIGTLRPADMVAIPSPIVGHVGLLGARTDFALISYLAKERPNWSFVFVGPITTNTREYIQIRRFSNVYFLGGKPARQVPSYLAAFDVCAVFYKQTIDTETLSSMKLYLYLASGKPLVSNPLGGAQLVPDFVYLANSPQEFLSQIERALKDDKHSIIKRRLEYARQNSWDERANYIHELMVKGLERRKNVRTMDKEPPS